MYTGPQEDDDAIEQERRKFEAELLSYYALHNAQAQRLEGFVCAFSAAVFAETESQNATRVRFEVPTLLDDDDTRGKIKQAEIALTASGAIMDPSFMVPAEVFYALGAIMPSAVPAEQRYQMAVLQDEPRVLEELQRAIDSGVVIPVQTSDDEPPRINDLTLSQITRRLHALGVIDGSGVSFELSPAEPEHALVQAWLDFEGDDIGDFWSGALPTHAVGHLDLTLCAVTQNHEALIAAIKGDGEDELGIASVATLAELGAGQWRDLFLPRNDDGEIVPRIDLLPAFTQPGSPDERVSAFIRHLQRFFNVSLSVEAPTAQEIEAPPLLRISPQDPIQRFVNAYDALIGGAGDPFEFGTEFSEFHFRSAVEQTFPDAGHARQSGNTTAPHRSGQRMPGGGYGKSAGTAYRSCTQHRR